MSVSPPPALSLSISLLFVSSRLVSRFTTISFSKPISTLTLTPPNLTLQQPRQLNPVQPMGLSEKTIQVVEKTAPAVAAAGPVLTAAIYKRMFDNNPELLDTFNIAHQRNLAQPKALFEFIVAYATHLRNLEAIIPTVERIAQKHTSFNVKPDQYQIVGHNLLKTIEETLNPGDEVLAEWGKAYEFLANIFIAREEEIYAETERRPGGWRPTRTFTVAEKVRESDIITRFRLVPADGKPCITHQPGQYLAIFARHPSLERQEIRQYSIVSAPNTEFYEIALKRHDQGVASRYMHDLVNVGDQLQLAPPCGDFFLQVPAKADTPVVMLSGGVGQTPLMSMLNDFVSRKDTRPLYWLHSAHDSKVRAFHSAVLEKATLLPNLKPVWWLSKPAASDVQGKDYDFEGHIDLEKVPEVFQSADAHYYFVGPHGFMAKVEKDLKAKGIPDSRIHFECFGPFSSLS